MHTYISDITKSYLEVANYYTVGVTRLNVAPFQHVSTNQDEPIKSLASQTFFFFFFFFLQRPFWIFNRPQEQILDRNRRAVNNRIPTTRLAHSCAVPENHPQTTSSD